MGQGPAACCCANDEKGQNADLPMVKLLQTTECPDETDGADVVDCVLNSEDCQNVSDMATMDAEDKAVRALLEKELEKVVQETKAGETQAAQKPETEEATADKVLLEFTTEGSVKVVELCEAPHGMVFGKGLPMVVTELEPDSAGAEAGVKEGWVLTKVSGRLMSDLENYSAAFDIFTKQTASLQPVPGKGAANPTVFVFEKHDGSSTHIEFAKSPFGMTLFQKKMPLELLKTVPGGEAERLGVQGGWKIQSIGGRSLEKYDYSKAMDFIKSVGCTLEKAAR
jgi:C-terminal processing protease CtpA/Prc